MPTGARKNSSGKYQNGNWNVKNLRFLVDFMDATGMTTTDVANKIGLSSRQSVYHWLVTDDVKFSNIIKFFDACGYDIRFSFTPVSMGWISLMILLEEHDITDERTGPVSRMGQAFSPVVAQLCPCS